MKLVGFSHSNKIDFHMKDFALGLISKARVFETEKWLPRTQTSLSRCVQRKAARRKRASPFVFQLSLIPCASSPVTRVSLAFRALLFCAKTKHLRRKLETPDISPLYWWFPHEMTSEKRAQNSILKTRH